jgi:hypothetical protein
MRIDAVITSPDLTVKQRFCIHLLEIKAIEEPGISQTIVASEDRTQDGIAAACGVTRPHVTIELGRAKREGMVTEELCHIEGRQRRAYAYTLTFKGMREAEKIKEREKGQTHFDQERGTA